MKSMREARPPGGGRMVSTPFRPPRWRPGTLGSRWLAWSAILLAFLTLNLLWQNHEHHELALDHARSLYRKDLAYRRHPAAAGAQPPSPAAPPFPEARLACAVPSSSSGRLASLRPLSPEHAPDPWEAKALRLLQVGAPEVYATERRPGGDILRYMAPVKVEAGCMACHAEPEFRAGDLAGGLGVTVPFSPLLTLDFMRTHGWDISMLVAIWGAGLGTIAFATRREAKRDRQRLQAEAALAESQANLRNLLESAKDAMYIVDMADRRFLDVNPTACAQLGYTREELLELGPEDIDAPESVEKIKANQALLKEHGRLLWETRQIRRDGTVLHVELNACLVTYHGREAVLAFARDLTPRMNALEKIRRLASWPEENPHPVLEFGPGRTLLYANPAAKEALAAGGRDLDAAVFLPVGDDLPPYREVDLGGRTYGVWYHPGKDQGALRVYATDMTAQKALETERRESETRYRHLFESMVQGCVFQDEGGVILFANPAAEEILGLGLDQMLGRYSADPRWKAVKEDGTPFQGDQHPAMAALATGRPVREVTMGIHNPVEDRTRWILVNAMPEIREGERRPYRVFTTFQDITRLKEAQDHIERLNANLGLLVKSRTLELEDTVARLQREIQVRVETEEALLRAEARNRALLDAIPDLIFIQDGQGTILDWKGQAGHLLFPPARLAGRKVAEVLPDEAGRLVEESIRETLATGRPQTFEAALPVPDRGERRFEARTVRGGQGLVITLFRDVTEMRRHDALERDHAALEARSRMAAYLAHEINNPLAGIKHSFEVLAGGIPEGHPDYAFVGIIRRELDRIAGIIRTAYALHRPGPPQVRECRVAEVLQDLGHLLRPRFKGKGAALQLPKPDGFPIRRIHEDILRQVLFNVLQNALEASPPGGTVRCGAREEEGFIVLDVEDEGQGIMPDVGPRLFEPGFTTKTAPEMGGLGLGLATCRNLLEAVRGSIAFRNRDPGPGACFTIRLPWQA